MRIVTGVASTTHVDMHQERFAKNALKDMAKQIKSKYIPNLIDHDPNQQIGTLLYAEVFRLDDGEYALGVVAGQFENDGERLRYKNGHKNTQWQKYKSQLDIDALRQKQTSSSSQQMGVKPTPKSELRLEQLLDIHLASTRVDTDGNVCKIKKLVGTTGDLRIEVYPKDHKNQPHFHVISRQRGINARFDLNTLELMSTKSGKIRKSDIRKIQNFFQNEERHRQLRQDHAKLNRD